MAILVMTVAYALPSKPSLGRPKWPKISPPIGRATNPMAKVPSAANVPTAGSLDGKNTAGNTSAAATP